MHLTRHSDYSLRVLMFLAVKQQPLTTIPEIAEAYGISRAHLMKVVHELSLLGYVSTVRGRGGGLTLGKAADRIRIGEVLRHTERSTELLECFSRGSSGRCRIEPACKLKGAFREALQAFFEVLDRYTLADLTSPQAAPLQRLLRLA